VLDLGYEGPGSGPWAADGRIANVGQLLFGSLCTLGLGLLSPPSLNNRYTSTGYGWESLRQVCATLLGARHVPVSPGGGLVYLRHYNKCPPLPFLLLQGVTSPQSDRRLLKP